MKRETVNRIRYVLEELIPPFIRDSVLFRYLFRLHWGQHIDDLASFRQRAAFLSPEEYRALYERHPRVQDETDNSNACLERISQDTVGPSVCDVGCGTGFLLNFIAQKRAGEFDHFTGVDIVLPNKQSVEIEFVESPIEQLPFPDKHFDTVICTHVLEHALDFRKALQELRRICKHRLIVVVPREREYIYTFNPHFNFFPYRHSFLRYMIPIPEKFVCDNIGRDIYYMEDQLSINPAVSPDPTR